MPAGDMRSGRYAPTTTTLPDGRVLVAGGYFEPDPKNGECVATAQLFTLTPDSPTGHAGTWTDTGRMRIPRNFATATLLNNGLVLIAGGYNTRTGSLDGVELYHPTTGRFTHSHYARLHTPRELFTATLFPASAGAYAGKVLLVGGYRTGHGTQRSAEIYDPATNRFALTGAMQTRWGRFGHAAVALPDGDVLIVGGKEHIPHGAWNSLKSVEVFHTAGPAAGTFTTLGEMQFARDRPTIAWIPAPYNKVLVIGGQGVDAKGASIDVKPCEWIDPYAIAPHSVFSLGPSLAQGRMAHTATTLPNGDILVVGGWSVYAQDMRAAGTTNTAERFVLATGQIVPAGATADSRLDAGAALVGGQVLIAGGKHATPTAGTYPPRAEVYTPPAPLVSPP
jgi:hypothetical protein